MLLRASALFSLVGFFEFDDLSYLLSGFLLNRDSRFSFACKVSKVLAT